MEITFGKVFCTTQFIQKVINDKNENFVFDCDFVEGMKIMTLVPSSLFIEYHDYHRRVRAGTQINNPHL
jgi:hypothetical protein